MDEQTNYEKVSDTEVKVTTIKTETVEDVVSISDLQSSKDAALAGIDAENERYQTLLARLADEHQGIIDPLQAQSDKADKDIAAAKKAGVKEQDAQIATP